MLRRSVLLPVLLLAACSDVAGPGQPAIQLDRQIVSAYARFGFDLFAELRAAAPDSNVFVSPTSAAFALAMTYNGATGETRDGMARALGIEDMSVEQANQANRQWLDALRNTGDVRVELALANSIWTLQGFPFHASFLERNRQYYDATVRELPFDDAAVTAINDWASDNTRGRIDRIIDSLNGDEVMFLINALYFKGAWRYAFDPKLTKPDSFRRLDGSVVQVQLMNQRVEVPYLRGDGFQLVSLPYGDGRFSMVFVLPDHGRTPGDVAHLLTPSSWSDLLSRAQKQEVGVLLPRFRIEWEALLNEPLARLGMARAFEPDLADFSDMSPHGRRLFISFVRQRTFVEVNEEGTEAAAVTAVGVGIVCAGCGPSYPVVSLTRPFLFAIQDNATRTVLFLGQITDPS